MSWGIVAASVITAGAGYASSQAASRAASRGANSANAEQARQYDQTREDFRQQRELGQGATSLLGQLYGIPVQSAAQAQASRPVLVGDTELPAGTTTRPVPSGKGGWYEVWFDGRRIGTLRPGGQNGQFINDTGTDINSLAVKREAAAGPQTTRPDMSVFFQSPDYQFNLAEGQKAIDRSLAARGRSLSGAGVKEGIRYASGMASNEFGNFYNRLANLAGIGQAATQATTTAGMNAANNISQNQIYAGNARANGYMNTGQAINNAVQGGISNYMLARYLQPQNPSPGTPPYAGGTSDPYGFYRGGGVGLS